MEKKIKRERTKCEVWSRVVGYLRPTSRWNEGKISEFKDRKMFGVKTVGVETIGVKTIGVKTIGVKNE